MPAKTEKQANYFRLVRAVQEGHEIQGVSRETKRNVRKTAHSTTKKQAADFAHMAKKPKGQG